jgi:hypothetical protein
MTEEDEDAQRVEEIDVAVVELMRVAEDETLSALTRVRTWDLIRRLEEEKTEILARDRHTWSASTAGLG